MKFNANFVFGIYLCVISIISLPLNTVVLIALVKGRKKIRRLWIPLISLPISNILQVCAAHPLAITTGFRGDWIFGEFGINWFSFISGLCGFSNIFIHAVLSLERCAPMVLSLRQQQTFSLTKLKLLVIGSWLFAAFISILPVLGWSCYIMEPISTYSGPNWDRSTQSLSYMGFILIFGFILPQVFIFISNLLFWKNVSIKTNCDQKGFLKLFIILSMLGFDICWGPYAVCGALRMLTKIEISLAMLYVCGVFSKLAGIINVFILIVLKRECRNMMLQLLCFTFFKKEAIPLPRHL